MPVMCAILLYHFRCHFNPFIGFIFFVVVVLGGGSVSITHFVSLYRDDWCWTVTTPLGFLVCLFFPACHTDQDNCLFLQESVIEYGFGVLLLVFGNQSWIRGCLCGGGLKRFSGSASLWLHFLLGMENKLLGSSALALSVWWIAFAALFSWQTIANLCLIFLSAFPFPPPFFPTFPPHPSSPPSFPPLCLSIGIHQARTFSPTARRSARPSGTPTAAGCRLLCRLMGARGQITVATCTCPAWTPRCRTLRYLPPSTFPTSSPWPRPPPRPTIGHSPPLARMVRGHSHTTAFTNTSISSNSSTAPAR